MKYIQTFESFVETTISEENTFFDENALSEELETLDNEIAALESAVDLLEDADAADAAKAAQKAQLKKMAAAKKAQKEKLAKKAKKPTELGGLKVSYLKRTPSGRARLEAAGLL